jgi:hypothetical protein
VRLFNKQLPLCVRLFVQTHTNGRFFGATVGLDAAAKKKYVSLPGIETQSFSN